MLGANLLSKHKGRRAMAYALLCQFWRDLVVSISIRVLLTSNTSLLPSTTSTVMLICASRNTSHFWHFIY